MNAPRIFITKSVKHDHAALRELILFGMHELDDETEIHVKARNVKHRHEVTYRRPAELGGGLVRAGGPRSVLIERYGKENVRKVTDWGPYWCTGVAYWGVPAMASVEHCTQQLVTLTVPNPAAYACNTFPHGHVYPGKERSSAPWPRTTFTRWEHDVIHTAAHEARHVLQYMRNESRGEMEAERYALCRLVEWKLNADGPIANDHPWLDICDGARCAPDVRRDSEWIESRFANERGFVIPVDLIESARHDFTRRQREAPVIASWTVTL